MSKTIPYRLMSGTFIVMLFVLILSCDSTNSDEPPDTIAIGLNLAITGDFADTDGLEAAELYVEKVNASGGVVINGNTYTFTTVLEDNEGTAEGAVAATQSLITEQNVMAIIGPQSSLAAIPAGEVANELKTVLISSLATNSKVTLNRPYVFRVPFLDSFQGKVLANFAHSRFEGSNACVLFAADNAYSKGLSESFKTEFDALGGVVDAYESFMTGEEDLSPQLTNMQSAQCGFIFLPQFATEVSPIVKQAHEMGITAPFLGGDAWGANQTLLEECGADCEGYFLTKMFNASGATGIAKEFIDDYQIKYGSVPGDEAALTHDAMLLIEHALKNCGSITGDLATDRTCVRNGMATIQDFEGVTGNITFDENGDPQKCVFIMQIVDGTFTHYDIVCP